MMVIIIILLLSISKELYTQPKYLDVWNSPPPNLYILLTVKYHKNLHFKWKYTLKLKLDYV